jgi:hypothetical protein
MLAPRAWICGFDGSETESYSKRFPHSGFESKAPAMSALQSADEYGGALSCVFSQTPSDGGDG